MKIKLFTALLLALISLSINAQVPNWQWAKSAGSIDNDNGNSIAIDGNGNTYVIGTFQSSTITFDTIVLTNSNNLGTADIFIMKYDAGGNTLWAKSVGGTGHDFGNSICTDAAGNVFVTGNFESPSITFDGNTLINTGSGNTADIFIAKYDASGSVIWVKSAGGISTDNGKDISADAAGNIFVTGGFQGPGAVFDNITLTSPGGYGMDIFICKYDASGTALWAKRAGGTSSDYGTSIHNDASGNAFITGEFQSASIAVGNTTLTNAGPPSTSDIFIAGYNISGNELWARSSGGISDDYATGICTDPIGNAHIVGSFRSVTIIFGGTTLTNTNNSGYESDIFIAKYDGTGNVVWAKIGGGNNIDESHDISTDPAGNTFVTGIFWGQSVAFGSMTLTASGWSNVPDIFIVKYNTSGNVLWAKSVGGDTNESINAICTDVNGNAFVTGTFYSTTIPFGTTILTRAGAIGTRDIFVARLGDNTTGIKTEVNSAPVNIFPNPFSTEVVLQTGLFLNNATLTINNCLGQTVKQITGIWGQSFILHRDDLPAGLYFIGMVQDGKVIISEKLMIAD